jgi:hypothetical protein
METRVVELVDALVCRLIGHMATFVTVAPSTSLGSDTDATTKAKAADRRAVLSTAGSVA